jgi:hypothetical protein
MPSSSQCAESARFLMSAASKDDACGEPRGLFLGLNALAPAREAGLSVAAPPWVRAGREMLGGEGAFPGAAASRRRAQPSRMEGGEKWSQNGERRLPSCTMRRS